MTERSKKKKILGLLLLLLLLGAALWFLVPRKGGVPDIRIDKTQGYKLLVDKKPYPIRGVCYSPVPVGRDYDFNLWGDPDKAWMTDGQLMKDMGVNTIRVYRPGKNPDEVRLVLNEMNSRFGIKTLMGTYLGFWNWPPPNYTDEEFREKIRQETMETVRLYKDSPGILMWVLGNENNYSFDMQLQRWTSDAIEALPDEEARRKEKARIYYTYVNDIAKEIKKIDPKHPIMMGVGEVKSLDSASKYCPDIDVLGMLAYRGPTFGNLFRQVKQKFDIPVVMIEYGADSFNALKRRPDEKAQAEFLKLQWQDIARNMDPKKGVGNCLGGTIFEWNDEWWKGNENLPHTWTIHEEAGHWGNSSYYYDADVGDRLNMNEEWFGVVSLEPKAGDTGLDKRVPKKAYTVLQKIWTKKIKE